MAGVNARVIAPLAAFGATWAVRRAMASAYARRTGHAPPLAEDPETSLRSVILWSVATAMASAAIEVVITRIAVNRDMAMEIDTTALSDATGA